VSARDIWAIAAGPRSDSVERFGGRRWSHVRTGRVLVGVRWHDILALSADNVWILGNAATSHGSGRLVLAHWNGRRWVKFTTALAAWAGQLAPAGPGRVAATAVSSALLGDGLVAELTGQGHLTWSAIGSSFGTGVSDVAYTPATRTLWASGAIETRLGGNAAIWALTEPRARKLASQGDVA
jgi:hypothetical protein